MRIKCGAFDLVTKKVFAVSIVECDEQKSSGRIFRYAACLSLGDIAAVNVERNRVPLCDIAYAVPISCRPQSAGIPLVAPFRRVAGRLLKDEW